MLILDLFVIIPLFVAATCALTSRFAPRIGRWIALAAPLSQAVLLGFAAAQVRTDAVFGAVSPTAASLWRLRADGLSFVLLGLTVVVGLLAISASWGMGLEEGDSKGRGLRDRGGAEHKGAARRPSTVFALLALLQGCIALVFLADSMLLFYVAWESVLIPGFFLIAGGRPGVPRRAAMRFLVYVFAGGVLLFAGIILALATQGYDSISLLTKLADADAVTPVGRLVFWLVAAAFLIKLPAVPLHAWLPDAYTEAPAGISIFFAGILAKMGAYGLLRVAAPLAPQAFAEAT
ncbi:MAG: hypothetical protein FWE94_02660, partial [Coriobacteriia bacterium]|nr:hypothetical protein [Coriobacteriia bacterium]